MRKQYLYFIGGEFLEEKINNYLQNIKEINCGYGHIILLDQQNNVHVCGTNSNGQLGLNSIEKSYSTFTQIEQFNNNVKFIGAGGYFSTVVTFDNKIFLSGMSFINDDSTTFKEMNNYTFGIIIKKIKCGSGFLIVMNEKNELFGCGLNGNYQLGFETNSTVSSLTKLNLPKHLKVKDFSCSYVFTTILTEDGEIYFAGDVDNTFYRGFTKFEIPFYCEQFASQYYLTFVLKKDTNELFDCKNLDHNLNSFNSKIKKIYSSLGSSDLYILLEDNSVYKLNGEGGSTEFQKIEKLWKYPFLNVYSGDNFAVILSSSFNIEKEESKEKLRMIGLLFNQTNNCNPFCDVKIYTL